MLLRVLRVYSVVCVCYSYGVMCVLAKAITLSALRTYAVTVTSAIAIALCVLCVSGGVRLTTFLRAAPPARTQLLAPVSSCHYIS